jgi:UDP-3-O-[3-hydroxymyristoyl] glucosamine N-acyltransferase
LILGLFAWNKDSRIFHVGSWGPEDLGEREPENSRHPWHARKDSGVNVTVQQLAELVGGTLVGDGTIRIQAARPLKEAGPGHITFLENEKHLRHLASCQASAVVLKTGLSVNGRATILVAEPLAAFLTIFRYLHGQPSPPPHGLDARAHVHPTAQLGDGVSLHPFACVGAGTVIGKRCCLHSGVVLGRNCQLGDDVVLYPNVVVYDGCKIGNRVIVHANAVIGSDGFGYRLQQGRHVKVPQLGTVEIEDDVEIGACTTIDRGAFQATRIGAGTKIDNLVQVAHNCTIGKHNVFASQVGIAGSSTTGDYVTIAGQVGVADHIHLGDRCLIGAQAGVMRDVPEGQFVFGAPAQPEREMKQIMLSLERLPGLRRDVRQIKQKLGMTEEPGT